MSNRITMANKLKKHILIPGLLAAVFGIICLLIIGTKPAVKRANPAPEHAIVIEVQKVQAQVITPRITSYGNANPLTRTTLSARINGAVESISEKARAGAHFNKGDALLQIEQIDYEIEKRIANAHVVDAESKLASEIALGEEAMHDWKASGRTGDPPPLALRKPQLRAAEAALASAKAQAQRADLNLQRTTISAPYDGYVLNLHVDLGDYVSMNAPIVEIFSDEAAEISLPIKNIDLPLLPLHLIHNSPETDGFGTVMVQSTTDPSRQWKGKLVRGSHEISRDSRQQHVVARIDSPFEATEENIGLKVNEYVVAKIQGAPMHNVIVVPNKAIYQNSYLYVYENNTNRTGQVFRRSITLGWRDNQHSAVTNGLKNNEYVVLTPLGQVPSGTLANIKGEDSDGENIKLKSKERRTNKGDRP